MPSPPPSVAHLSACRRQHLRHVPPHVGLLQVQNAAVDEAQGDGRSLQEGKDTKRTEVRGTEMGATLQEERHAD